MNGSVIQSLIKRGDIKGGLNETLLIPAVSGIAAERILLLGCGEGKKLSPATIRKLLGTALRTLGQNEITDATLFLDNILSMSCDVGLVQSL